MVKATYDPTEHSAISGPENPTIDEFLGSFRFWAFAIVKCLVGHQTWTLSMHAWLAESEFAICGRGHIICYSKDKTEMGNQFLDLFIGFGIEKWKKWY